MLAKSTFVSKGTDHLLSKIRFSRFSRLNVVVTSCLLWLQVSVVDAFPLNQCSSSRKSISHKVHNTILIEPKNQQDMNRVPLSFCVGTAQTAKLWENLASQWGRRVLLFQPIGLGPDFEAIEHLYPDISLKVQVQSLLSAIQDTFGEEEVDLGGFSLGGRIALAAACERSFRRLHITGVALERSGDGLREIQNWRDYLEAGDMTAFARTAIQASYASQPAEDRLPLLVDSIRESQMTRGILRLLNEAHDEKGPYSVKGIASRLSNQCGALVVGESDRLAPPKLAEALSTQLGWSKPVIVPEAGHSVPFEAARAWRLHLTQYLNNPMPT